MVLKITLSMKRPWLYMHNFFLAFLEISSCLLLLLSSHKLRHQPSEETHLLDRQHRRDICLDQHLRDQPGSGSEIHLLQEHHSGQTVSLQIA